MSRLSRLMALAAITAAAAQTGMTDLPVIEHRPLAKHKGESPKCKSCVHFKTKRNCCTPMQIACDSYERKKRKK